MTTGELRRAVRMALVSALRQENMQSMELPLNDSKAQRDLLGNLMIASNTQHWKEDTLKLIDQVYQQIANSPQNKAQILRQAQLELIKSEQFNHPYYWAPFVLVGNWI